MFIKSITIFFSYLVFAIYFILIVSLFYFLDFSRFPEIILSERTVFSIKISLISSTVSTILALLLALPSSYALSRYNFWGKHIIDLILEFPLIISPVALGATLLIFFNNPIGVWIQNNLIEFVFHLNGIILAQFISILGIAVRFLKTTLDEIPKRYEDVAQSLGVHPLIIFFKITLPLSKNGIIFGAVLIWAKSLGEFGATITIAGSMAMRSETLPIAIFTKLTSADIYGTVILIFVLFMTAFATLSLVRIIYRKDKMNDRNS
ncbi:MAG: ABC transporter permease [Leptonema sp. (in: bacteria)]